MMVFHNDIILRLEQSNGICIFEYADRLPIYAIKDEKYNGLKVYNQFYQDSGWRIMKGSTLYRQLRYGDYARKYEYAYHFAEWLGRRFAKRIISGKQRILGISAKRRATGSRNHGVVSCFNASFSHGFHDEYNKHFHPEDIHTHNLDVGLMQSAEWTKDGVVFSSLYLYFLSGIPDEAANCAKRLMREAAENDKIQAMELN